MPEKINKLYKPTELEAARDILYKCTPEINSNEDCMDTLKELHAYGWRLVKIDGKY